MLPLDALIAAVGQRLELDFLPEEIRQEVSERGRMSIEPMTCRTKKTFIFAGGDVVTGPKTVIDAISSGRRAALAISEYICPHSYRHLRVISNERILYHEVDVDESQGDALQLLQFSYAD